MSTPGTSLSRTCELSVEAPANTPRVQMLVRGGCFYGDACPVELPGDDLMPAALGPLCAGVPPHQSGRTGMSSCCSSSPTRSASRQVQGGTEGTR
jgi:hypothetical protein